MNTYNNNNNSRLFVYIYGNLGIGGIQAHIFKAAKYLRSLNFQVLIVNTGTKSEDPSYQSIIKDSKIGLVNSSSKIEISIYSYAHEHKVKEITIITFTIPDYIYIKSVQSIFCHHRLSTFYYVPNFKGRYYYLEETFDGYIKKAIRSRMTAIIQKMDKNDEIRYFSGKHQSVMTDYYGCQLKERLLETRVPRTPLDADVFDETKRREIYRRDEFRIISVSRFDFPHKGFIIGLIKEYGQLKKNYPNLTYTIIGYYDQGLQEIMRAIDRLDENAKKDIHVLGKCGPDELALHYADANINISVAGCCSLGAKVGIISLPTRHYSYECEVYGFYSTHKHMNTSSDPGIPVAQFIEKIISMTEQEYVDVCKADFDAFYEITSRSTFEDRNKCECNIMTPSDIKFINRICWWIDKIHPVKSYLQAMRELGVLTLMKRRLGKVLKMR